MNFVKRSHCYTVRALVVMVGWNSRRRIVSANMHMCVLCAGDFDDTFNAGSLALCSRRRLSWEADYYKKRRKSYLKVVLEERE